MMYPEKIQISKKGPSPDMDSNHLALAISFHSGTYTIAVTSPLLIGSECLINKQMVSAGTLKESLQSDDSFSPLLSKTMDIIGQEPGSDEIILLSYFFLNPLPFSISMMTCYFSETGTNPARASILANAAFMARTERNESEPGFINNPDIKNFISGDFVNDYESNRTPETLTGAMILLQKSETLKFVYDCLPIESPDHSTTIPLVNLGQINESGFLVEDHATIIAGLAISITDLAKISEDKWPLFYIKLLSEIPLYLRDFYSLGRLLNKNPEILQFLTMEYHCKLEIISITESGKKHSTLFKDPHLGFNKPKPFMGIPLFMQIFKNKQN